MVEGSIDNQGVRKTDLISNIIYHYVYNIIMIKVLSRENS